MKWLGLFLLLLALTSAPTRAEDYTHSPDNCEFSITFPSEPYTARRCDPDNPLKCDNITSYTKVFGLDATVNFYVTCNPAEPGMLTRYSGDVMRTTLEAMVGNNRLDNYETGFVEHKNARQALILGTGTSGNSDKIYTAQLWIGLKSMFTVEGELIGTAREEADEMFANILQSIGLKEIEEVAEEKPEKEEEPEEK